MPRGLRPFTMKAAHKADKHPVGAILLFIFLIWFFGKLF